MYTLSHNFGRRETALKDSDFAVLGIPYDSTESYRTGSRHGPRAIREASLELEEYDMELDFDLNQLRISDLGDLEVSYGNPDETIQRTKETVEDIIKNGVIPICFGGEHTITYFVSTALNKNPFYVIFDAHLDYREDYIGNRLSHAAVSRRLSELVGAENILIVGVRSASSEELTDAKKDGVSMITANDFFNEPEAAVNRIIELTKGKEVHLSIDMDVFDPSEASDVCNPEPGGIYYRDFLETLAFLKNSKLSGLDITELCPTTDSYSQILAAKLTFKVLAMSKI